MSAIEDTVLAALGDRDSDIHGIVDELERAGTPLHYGQVAAALGRLQRKRLVGHNTGLWYAHKRKPFTPTPEATEIDKKTSEANIQRLIMLNAAKRGYTLWRNNVGKAWQGRRVEATGATVILASGAKITVRSGILLLDARPVDFGLCKGSSDLVGLKRVTITPDMVGKEIAQFAAVEVKSATGRPTPEQKNFCAHVNGAGGVSVIARKPEDVP